jgi:hypothetical protein
MFPDMFQESFRLSLGGQKIGGGIIPAFLSFVMP